MYHGNANGRQGKELHMVKKKKGMEKQQLTRQEPATSRSVANPLAVRLMDAGQRPWLNCQLQRVGYRSGGRCLWSS